MYKLVGRKEENRKQEGEMEGRRGGERNTALIILPPLDLNQQMLQK